MQDLGKCEHTSNGSEGRQACVRTFWGCAGLLERLRVDVIKMEEKTAEGRL